MNVVASPATAVEEPLVEETWFDSSLTESSINDIDYSQVLVDTFTSEESNPDSADKSNATTENVESLKNLEVEVI